MYDITNHYRYLMLFAESSDNKGGGTGSNNNTPTNNPAANSNPAKTDNRTFWQKTRDNVKTAVSNIGVKNEAKAQWNSEKNKAKSDLNQAKADYKAGKISADELAKRENSYKNYKNNDTKNQRIKNATTANAENIKKKTTELNDARKKEENKVPEPVLPSSPPPNTDNKGSNSDTNGGKKGFIDKAIDKVKGVKDTVKNDFTKAMGNKDEGNTLSQNWDKLKNTWNSDENKDKGFFDKLKNVYDTHKDAFKEQYGGALRDIGVGAAALGGGGMLMRGLMGGRPAYGANYGLRPPIQSGNMFGGGMNMLQNLGGIGKMLGMFSENEYNVSKYKYLNLFSEIDFSNLSDVSTGKLKKELNKLLNIGVLSTAEGNRVDEIRRELAIRKGDIDTVNETTANRVLDKSEKHGKLMRNLAIAGGAGALGLGALATSSIMSRHKMNNALSNRFTGRIALKRAGYGAMIPHYRKK